MKIIIIEDEKPAAEKLRKALLQYDASIQLKRYSNSVDVGHSVASTKSTARSDFYGY